MEGFDFLFAFWWKDAFKWSVFMLWLKKIDSFKSSFVLYLNLSSKIVLKIFVFLFYLNFIGLLDFVSDKELVLFLPDLILFLLIFLCLLFTLPLFDPFLLGKLFCEKAPYKQGFPNKFEGSFKFLARKPLYLIITMLKIFVFLLIKAGLLVVIKGIFWKFFNPSFEFLILN